MSEKEKGRFGDWMHDRMWIIWIVVFVVALSIMTYALMPRPQSADVAITIICSDPPCAGVLKIGDHTEVEIILIENESFIYHDQQTWTGFCSSGHVTYRYYDKDVGLFDEAEIYLCHDREVILVAG